MVSILTSTTMVAITAYFMIAGLFLVTEGLNSIKNPSVIVSFILWATGGLVFIYTSSYASAHGLMGISAIVGATLTVASVLLLGKIYFISDGKDRTTNNRINNA